MVWKSVSVVVGVVVSDSVLVTPPSESDSVCESVSVSVVVAARVWVRVDWENRVWVSVPAVTTPPAPRLSVVHSVAVELSVSVGVIVVLAVTVELNVSLTVWPPSVECRVIREVLGLAVGDRPGGQAAAEHVGQGLSGDAADASPPPE